jgi:hypothetical protein
LSRREPIVSARERNPRTIGGRAIQKAAFKLQSKNDAVTEMSVIPDRGHSLVIDHGWQNIANVAEEFITKNVQMPLTSS